MISWSAYESKFNELGEDGWEFVHQRNELAVFKRPKQ